MSRFHALFLLLLGFLGCRTPVAAQYTGGVPASASSPDSFFTLQAVRTPIPPVIDGIVDDSVWAGAAAASGFIQYEPSRGQPSGQPTRALVLYDETALYIAFQLVDAEPPTAQLTRRDADLMNDDAVILVLDSHNDHRAAYYFMTNALGTQTDGRIADDGRTVDPTWDAAWQSVARPTPEGWSVEMAIPFTSIKYNAGEDRTWGINFGRSRRRSLELSYWSGPLDHAFRVSQAGALTGLNIPPPSRRHQLIVYGLGRLQDNARNDRDAGADFSYALTPEMSAFITINPDFATIEADQEQVNLTRFELSLPEKRPFFLQGAELFRQRIRTFYSRRIPDITAGTRLLGKTGPWTLAFLGAHSPEQSGDLAVALYGVTRFQRDIGESSNVALTVADRVIGGNHHGSASTDATLFFTRTLGMTAQLVQSWGEFASGTWAYFIRPAFDSPTWHFHVRCTHLGNHFAEHVNAIGFVSDDDRRELDSALDHTFWLRGRTVERIVYDSNYNIYWSQNGPLRSWQIDESVSIEFRNRLSFQGAHTEEFKRFEKDFRNRRTALLLGYNTRAFQSARVGFQTGRNFDADFRLWTAAGAYKLTRRLALEYELQHLQFKPDPEGASTWIHVLRANHFFTKDLYLQAFFQSNSAIDRRNVQAVFVYRYRPPFGTIQVAYQRGTAAFGERSEQGNTLFLKLTGVF